MLQILARLVIGEQKTNRVSALFLMAFWLIAQACFANEKQSSEPVPIKGLVIFGDSLSDNVNTWRLSHYYMGMPDPLNEDYKTNYFQDIFAGLVPRAVTNIGPSIVPFPTFPAPPYDRGYFSNGPVAVEYIALYAGLDLNNLEQYRNMAFGASWTTNLFDNLVQSWSQKRLPGLRLMFQGKILPPSFSAVTDAFLKHNPQLDPDVIYAVYFNGNDYLNGFSDPAVVVSRQFTNVRKLINAGARHIFWGLVPDYAMAPCFHKGPRRDVVAQWGHEHNSYVRKLAEGTAHAWPQVKLILGDIGEIFRNVAHDLSHEGGVLDRPCVNVYIPGCDHDPGMVSLFQTRQATVCDNPDKYLFWDQVHATARVHRIASGYVCQQLMNEGYKLDCPDLQELKKL
ncbi:SGNH/GDSL hydrolase family protein [Parendozoicomonas sp. Alg238-R29]|uniref:SGNH/GDSL hydrolase family protein n=1 Tax=Parendozoicomonas sp. Alg238-R29 TaxID=2993446 RepID=UPI00248D4EA0|nr:SGNH/GDSL hydrolase family protein [Parendozoicomonas sp. Alg238-R29]